ncbi:hypothetical protein WDW89_08730 [Deltaproteobacteria bacterium TL4]
MIREVDALHHILKNSGLEPGYVQRLFRAVQKVEPNVAKIIRINMDRYIAVDGIEPLIANKSDYEDKFAALVEIFPSFLFMSAAQFNSSPIYQPIARHLFIASIACICARKTPNMEQIRYFLDSLDSKEALQNLNAKVFNRNLHENTTYFPRIIHWDMFLIAKNFLKVEMSSQRDTLIENLYFTEGIFLIFSRYYFDLLCQAPSDKIARHIHDIFEKFFIFLGVHEENYWKRSRNPKVIKKQIQNIILKDLPTLRHSEIRQNVFDLMHAYNPLVHDGQARKMTLHTQQYLDQQTQAFRKMPYSRMMVFMKTIMQCKGVPYFQYLIAQLIKESPKRLLELENHLRPYLGKEEWIPLLKHVHSVVVNISKDNALFLSEKTQKLKNAQQKIIEQQGKIMRSEQDAEQYRNIYLEKLYERCANPNALNQHKIAEYLDRLALATQEMLGAQSITPQIKKVYEESINCVFDDLCEEGGMNAEELSVFQAGTQEALGGIENADEALRHEKIKDIGNAMSQAVETVDRNLEAQVSESMYRDGLKIEITIEDEQKKITATVEQLLDIPTTLSEKIRMLHGYVPIPLRPQVLRCIENVQNRVGKSFPEPVAIFSQDGLLLKKRVINLLLPEDTLEQLLKKPTVPIDLTEDAKKISLKEFFSFPFAKTQMPNNTEWFDLHLKYLKMLVDRKLFSSKLYQHIALNLRKIPKLEYRKYFNIFPNDRFEDTAFFAVIDMWQNNALVNLRAQKQT